MKRKVIENVPRIAQFLDNTSMLTPFIGSLYAALHGMGRPRPYAELLALSGAGNRLSWRPGEWFGGNCDILSCEEPPFAAHERVLKAVGLKGEICLVKPVAGMEAPFVDEKQARDAITRVIDAGVPVIAMGIIGPPECCVVHGYDADGDKLIGWNYFQADEGFKAERPFEKADWFKNLAGYILLSPAGKTPAMRESALAALRAIVDHACHVDVRGAKVGLMAWEAMLEQLENAAFDDCVQTLLPGPDEMWEDWAWEKTLQGRFFVYCDALCQIHERGMALPFWEQMRETYLEWQEPLNEAIGVWRKCAEYGGFLWQYVSMDETGYKQFARPEIRKLLSEEGRRAMALDRQAIAAVQQLLKDEAEK